MHNTLLAAATSPTPQNFLTFVTLLFCPRLTCGRIYVFLQVIVSPSLTIGKVFLLSTRKLLVTKLSWVKGLPVTVLSLKWNSKLITRVWFGLLGKLFDSFRHDLAGISRFSADAHRHQVFSWTVFQAGWSLVSFIPWALVHHHLSLGYELDHSVTQHSP